jgi:hypothetical protein
MLNWHPNINRKWITDFKKTIVWKLIPDNHIRKLSGVSSGDMAVSGMRKEGKYRETSKRRLPPVSFHGDHEEWFWLYFAALGCEKKKELDEFCWFEKKNIFKPSFSFQACLVNRSTSQTSDRKFIIPVNSSNQPKQPMKQRLYSPSRKCQVVFQNPQKNSVIPIEL